MLDSTSVPVTRLRWMAGPVLLRTSASTLVLMRSGPARSGARCEQMPERLAGIGHRRACGRAACGHLEEAVDEAGVFAQLLRHLSRGQTPCQRARVVGEGVDRGER